MTTRTENVTLDIFKPIDEFASEKTRLQALHAEMSHKIKVLNLDFICKQERFEDMISKLKESISYVEKKLGRAGIKC